MFLNRFFGSFIDLNSSSSTIFLDQKWHKSLAMCLLMLFSILMFSGVKLCLYSWRHSLKIFLKYSGSALTFEDVMLVLLSVLFSLLTNSRLVLVIYSQPHSIVIALPVTVPFGQPTIGVFSD